jgi:hypothetical protein
MFELTISKLIVIGVLATVALYVSISDLHDDYTDEDVDMSLWKVIGLFPLYFIGYTLYYGFAVACLYGLYLGFLHRQEFPTEDFPWRY